MKSSEIMAAYSYAEKLQKSLGVTIKKEEGESEEKVPELSLKEIGNKVLEAIKKDDVSGITPFFKTPMDTNMLKLTRTSIMDAADFGSIKCAKFIISFYPEALNMKDEDGRLPVDRANISKKMNFVNFCWAARCEIAESSRSKMLESSSKRQKISHDDAGVGMQL
jgi:hypothetical protein